MEFLIITHGFTNIIYFEFASMDALQNKEKTMLLVKLIYIFRDLV